MPTKKEVRMVEKAIIDGASAITLSKLKKTLKGKVDDNSITEIVEMFDKKNWVYIGSKGITWIRNTSPKWKKAVREAIDFDELRRKLAKKG
jgi:hypothetical protein